MALKIVKVRVESLAPLMLHNVRLANPLDDMAVKLKSITSKRKKTEDDHAELARVEWEGGLYFDEQIGPYVNGWSFVRSIQDGAKFSKKGRDVIRAVSTSEQRLPILYEGPRDIEGLWAAGFSDTRAVSVGTSKTSRTRPRWDKWALEAELEHETSMISTDDLLSCITMAGRFAGLGEYRPSSPKGGAYGKYRLAKVDGRVIEG